MRSGKTVALLHVVLPCILFLTARGLEKLLLAGCERSGKTDCLLSGSWIALMMECLILVVIVLIYKRQDRENRGISYRNAAYDLLIGVALGIVITFANRFLDLSSPIAFSAPELMVLCVVGPINEELVYRGMVLERSRGIFSVPVSILISSFLFAVAHGNLFQMIEAFLGGLLFGIITYRTNDVRNCCLTHAVTNAMIYFLSLAYKNM